MTDEELEGIGFLNKIQVPYAILPGETLSFETSRIVQKNRLKAGVEGAKWILSQLGKTIVLHVDSSDEEQTDLREDEYEKSIENLKTFLGENE